jgi:tetratricopeptide (TPR) repeat protein
MLSDVYVSMKRYDDAEALLLAARELLPEHDRIAFNLATVYERAGDDARALAELDRCLALHPTFALAHMRRGRILLRRGSPVEALAALEEAQRLGEDGPEVWRHSGGALAQLGRWSEAAEAFERALERYPDPRFALAAAEAYAKAGEAAAAWSALDRARELSPEEPRLAGAEALVRERCGERPR